MAKKTKPDSIKSQKKSLLLKVEGKLSESLTEFPKKLNDKKYKKVIHKAGKILTKSLVINPVKATTDKPKKEKTKKKKEESKTGKVS